VITIIDYGLGNIAAFTNVYKRMNIPARVARAPADLDGAKRLILPGVGAFDHAMNLLEASGMRGPLDELVQGLNVPVLGVCVGMQILGEESEEGERRGLGWVPGRVRALANLPGANLLPRPHMGWNDITPTGDENLFRGLEMDARFYFLHSYYFECADPAHSSATTDYGTQFSCAVRWENVRGVQFHPEKSHHFGAGLLRNFADA
jgi:glutamine amidotransferase